MVLRTALSVVTGIGFSRFDRMNETMIHKSSRPIDPKMIWRFRRCRRLRAACGETSGVVKAWCMKGPDDGGKRLKLSQFRSLQSKTRSQDRQLDAANMPSRFSYLCGGRCEPQLCAFESGPLPQSPALRSTGCDRAPPVLKPSNSVVCRCFLALHYTWGINR